MISQCSFSPDAIWVREVENGIRHITLRKNITQETITHEDTQEIIYQFEETELFIPDRENLTDFINENFGNLFDLGLQQTTDNATKDAKIMQAKQMIQDGSVVDNLQLLGQQITNIMLGV